MGQLEDSKTQVNFIQKDRNKIDTILDTLSNIKSPRSHRQPSHSSLNKKPYGKGYPRDYGIIPDPVEPDSDEEVAPEKPKPKVVPEPVVEEEVAPPAPKPKPFVKKAAKVIPEPPAVEEPQADVSD